MGDFSTESTVSTGDGHAVGHRGYSSSVHDEPQTIAPTHPLACIECRRPWLLGSERWRLLVTEDEPRETVPYCTACWSREFAG